MSKHLQKDETIKTLDSDQIAAKKSSRHEPLEAERTIDDRGDEVTRLDIREDLDQVVSELPF
jgi:hypothetical protein